MPPAPNINDRNHVSVFVYTDFRQRFQDVVWFAFEYSKGLHPLLSTELTFLVHFPIDAIYRAKVEEFYSNFTEYC